MKKNIFLKLIFLITLIALFFINIEKIREFVKLKLSHEKKIFIKNLFFGKKYIEEINFYRQIGYNRFKLPETQFEDFNFEKFSLNNISEHSTHYNNLKKNTEVVKRFFIEDLEDSILIASASGQFQKSINYNFEKFEIIKSNLSEFKIREILDIKKIQNNIFASYTFKKTNEHKCAYYGIAYSELKKNFLEFKNFYKGKECTLATNALGGRIFPYSFKSVKGFLISTGAADKEKNLAQNPNSFFGKIWFFDLEKKEKLLFSKGHRNPQGLIVYNGIILSTEHGPYGGDEINKIEFGKNYGFPISSYGEDYNFKNIKYLNPDYKFKKTHEKNNFEEPIFAFVPSIGISELEKVPDDFSKYWKDNFIITSLNARTLYRIKFDKSFNKVYYIEPIFVGERIRDIKYIKNKKVIAIALEETGSLGILKTKY